MYAFYWIRLILAAVFVFANAYLLLLWGYVFLRIGITAAWLLAASNMIALIVSIINLLLAFDFQGVQHLIGPNAYYVLYLLFLGLQPTGALLTVIGITVLARQILRSRPPPIPRDIESPA